MTDRRTGVPDRRAQSPREEDGERSSQERRAADRWHGDYRYDHHSRVARPDFDRRKSG